jgi:hypothetical protein
LEISFYEIQLHCHRCGYTCGGKIEGNQFRILVFQNGKLIQEGESVSFSQIPAAYQKKFRAIYQFLTK